MLTMLARQIALLLLVSTLLPGVVQARSAGADAAESLLSQPTDSGWSLEAMMAARRDQGTSATPAAALAQPRQASAATDGTAVLSRQDSALQAAVNEARKREKKLRDQLMKMQDALAAAQQVEEAPVAVPLQVPAELASLRETLAAMAREKDVLTNQVSTLRAGLADRDARLKTLSGPQDAIRHSLAKKEDDLARAGRELAIVRAELAKKTAALAERSNPAALQAAQRELKDLQSALAQKSAALDLLQTQVSQQQADRAAAIRDNDAALAALRRQAAEKDAALKSLQDGLAVKEKALADLNTALAARSDELKQAAASLAALRAKQADKAVVLVSDVQRQSYMAGFMMAKGLSARLDGWQQAGVETEKALFRAGLADGLRGQVRLKPEVARRAQEAFMKAVRDGAARKVTQAQKQLVTLAAGRKPLKSAAGISWYRVHGGKPVAKGAPVTLSMTEQIAGGKIISRVPAMILQPDDDVPSIVKDGMYLPGEGGEVVAYALARSVYGELPLPTGVQPFTVMEYHLKGQAFSPETGRPQ
ncbi:FKBP-type peptidyl-prolyl cis-trans isomerase N-terminal domain-containing protein [Klebsiella aerogenes]|uniref:FKBP-type peptidyl-prolyl cis-trans isomerase N-terminal domain-containing protein n=1 Tax=Klebsiella aerogenes TaxID=548 RepID=UPI0019043EAD|nr:FKBP-type peptidyl-prolyl cis-trans isomerase N-terminal domain-containing protein [Klebsiella aerogenes]MBK0469652.1 hypothetical protein [Klebsiella aerogenes]